MQSLAQIRDTRTQEFSQLTVEFCGLVKKEGVSVRPFLGQGPTFFSAMPDPLQESTLQHFRLYVEVCREVLAQGGNLRNDQLFLWRMFQKLGAHPPSNLMNQIGGEDVVEIHNHEYVQIYRNLNFFSLCSYTLDDLLCRPFWQLFRRDAQVSEQLMEVGKRVFTHQIEGVCSLSLGQHEVEEIDSPGRFLSLIEYTVIAPLRETSGKIVAAVTAVRSISCVRQAPLPQMDSISPNQTHY